MLLNWPFWYALTARDMRSSNLTIESGCFDAILVENLVLMMDEGSGVLTWLARLGGSLGCGLR
jgi:hypothetical protein